MRDYFICSVGEPGKGYDDGILRLCMVHNCFVLHESNKYKGAIHEVSPGDILILKYQTNFVGYGRAISALDTSHDLDDGWSWTVKVNMWIMGNHVERYGIKGAQMSGTAYDTVKKVDRSFALGKLEEIGFPF